VFKTPGKLRGKTPRTARKKAAEPRQVCSRFPHKYDRLLTAMQPLGDLHATNSQRRPSLAEQSLANNLQKSIAKSRFHIAEDCENVAPAQSPAVKSPVPPPLFSKAIGKGKENGQSAYHAHVASPEPRPGTGYSTVPVRFSPAPSTQDTVMTQDDDVFSPPQTQSTQPTQATQSFRRSMHFEEDERRDTGESFVSAKEAFGSKNASKEDLRAKFYENAMDIDGDKPEITQSDVQDTVIRHELSSADEDTPMDNDIPDFPNPPRRVSGVYSISAETHEALETANQLTPEPKAIVPAELFVAPARVVSEEVEQVDDTVVHHHMEEDQMDIDDDVRSPSDGSSPVKPFVRKSSLTFASLPAREPLIAKKSMGNRVSRVSHVDPNKARNSNLGRFTGGKSLGGSQLQLAEPLEDDDMDLDDARPGLRREESETTKQHNQAQTRSLLDRINMLKQQKEAPKSISQNIMSQSTQAQSLASSQHKEPAAPSQSSQPTVAQVSQPAYPSLPPTAPEQNIYETDDDDWISPIRPTAAPAQASRPPLNKSLSADAQPKPAQMIFPKPISVSNPDLSTVVESTTPAGSPAGKKNMDGPLSASKAKFYSALRAAKEKIIGSSAASAQVKLDALVESPMRPKLKAQDSTDDIFGSPKRTDKPGLFSHLRSPSKESLKSGKTKMAAMPGSPTKDSNRRTRSSSEREKAKEKEAREKESRERLRAEEKLKEMREKEQSKAAQFQKKLATAKTPVAMASQPSMRQAAATAKTPVSVLPQSRPGLSRANTASKDQDHDSAEDMPPPPPPKSGLPTTGHKLREPKKLLKASSKETLPKSKPQHIMVKLNSSRYGQAPPAASRPTPAPAPVTAPSLVQKPSYSTQKAAPAVSRPAPAASMRPASAMSMKSAPIPKPIAAPVAKSAPRIGRPQPPKVMEKPAEKPKASAPQPRADLAAARPVARMQTIQDANRINVPPVNPAKPPVKRPFQPEGDETIHRPAKRPSQQAKMNTNTPAHAQFAKGKIPFAEPAPQPQPTPQIQYQNGEEIKLPEIMTDSEDEDSENEFEQPSWVNTPNLRELLSQQQLVDPEAIFGPIAPLNMEQVFPNKERHKRFRERTSSAYWAHDQVTEEEKRKEREARERLVKDGAWTYNPSPRPTPRPGYQ
jgi:hypothetical protein